MTVTHPEVTRFFMTISEAVQLTLQAATIGDTGATLVLDMGNPVKIVDVAKQMIALSRRSVDVVFSGLRPAEKMHEELFDDSELARPTAHELIQSVNVPSLSLNLLDGLGSEVMDELATLKMPAQRSDNGV